jgi:hypothetical protein
MSIYFNNWNDTGKCACYKALLSLMHILWEEILLENGNVILLTQLDDFPSGNSIQAIFTGGGPHLTVFYHKEISGIACGDMAVNIQHESFIHTRFVGFDAGRYAVKFTEAVDSGIL